MTLAKKIGLETSSCHILQGPCPLFIIERYDRKKGNNDTYARLHQEDQCQAQGVLAKNKYEETGGPSIQNNFSFLQKHIHVQHRFKALEQFLSSVAFNLLIGNNESHSKNISILRNDQGLYVLAPFYDLLSTAIYPRLQARFSLIVGDKNEFSKIGRNQIDQLEDQCEMKKGTFEDKLQETAQSIKKTIDTHIEELTDQWPEVKVFKKITSKIKQRTKTLQLQNAFKKT